MDPEEETLAQWLDELNTRQLELERDFARYRLTAHLMWPGSYMAEMLPNSRGIQATV